MASAGDITLLREEIGDTQLDYFLSDETLSDLIDEHGINDARRFAVKKWINKIRPYAFNAKSAGEETQWADMLKNLTDSHYEFYLEWYLENVGSLL